MTRPETTRAGTGELLDALRQNDDARLAGALRWLSARGVVELTRRDSGDWAAEFHGAPEFRSVGGTGTTLDRAVLRLCEKVLAADGSPAAAPDAPTPVTPPPDCQCGMCDADREPPLVSLYQGDYRRDFGANADGGGR